MASNISIVDLVLGGVAGAGLSAVFSSAVGLWRCLRPSSTPGDDVQITVGGAHRRTVSSITVTFQQASGDVAELL